MLNITVIIIPEYQINSWIMASSTPSPILVHCFIKKCNSFTTAALVYLQTDAELLLCFNISWKLEVLRLIFFFFWHRKILMKVKYTYSIKFTLLCNNYPVAQLYWCTDINFCVSQYYCNICFKLFYRDILDFATKLRTGPVNTLIFKLFFSPLTIFVRCTFESSLSN